MNKGKTIFAHIMSLFNEYEFKKCVNRYKGGRHAIKFNCRDQFMVMSFAQFTDRAGLRDIETTLNLSGDLYRSGLKVMPRSTLAEANGKKDWRIYQDFAMTLVKESTALYKDEKLRIGLEEMIYAFDSSTIELFFKLTKLHLHIYNFYGTTQNAVYTPILIAVCNNLLLIIAKKRYGLVSSLHSISNSIRQVLFNRAAILDYHIQQTVPAVVPETGVIGQLTLW